MNWMWLSWRSNVGVNHVTQIDVVGLDLYLQRLELFIGVIKFLVMQVFIYLLADTYCIFNTSDNVQFAPYKQTLSPTCARHYVHDASAFSGPPNVAIRPR